MAPDPVPVLRRHLESLRHYPDPTAATAALAEAMGVDRARLLLTNGGSEAIRLVSDEMGGRVVEPEFSLHPRGGGPLWRSNPHNPSGLLAARHERADVWDEAFYPLATGSWTRGDDDAVVVGSLTKLFACPGLRIGYVLAPPGDDALIDRVRRSPAPVVGQRAGGRRRYPISSLGVDLRAWSAGVHYLRGQLCSVLRAHGLAPDAPTPIGCSSKPPACGPV